MTESKDITLTSLVPVIAGELDNCQFGEVSLTLTTYRGRIVRVTVTTQYGSKSPMYSNPHPSDNA